MYLCSIVYEFKDLLLYSDLFLVLLWKYVPVKENKFLCILLQSNMAIILSINLNELEIYCIITTYKTVLKSNLANF